MLQITVWTVIWKKGHRIPILPISIYVLYFATSLGCALFGGGRREATKTMRNVGTLLGKII